MRGEAEGSQNTFDDRIRLYTVSLGNFFEIRVVLRVAHTNGNGGPVASATCRCLVTLVTNSLNLLVFLLLRFRRTPTTIPFAPPMLCVGDVIPPVRM